MITDISLKLIPKAIDPQSNYRHDRFILFRKQYVRVKLQSLLIYMNSKKNKSAPRQICNHFRQDGICGAFDTGKEVLSVDFDHGFWVMRVMQPQTLPWSKA